jgi:hypothetical protein
MHHTKLHGQYLGSDTAVLRIQSAKRLRLAPDMLL